MKYYQYKNKVINDFGIEQIMFDEHSIWDRDTSRGDGITHGVIVDFTQGTICTSEITYKDTYISEVKKYGNYTHLTDLTKLTEEEAIEILVIKPTISGYLENLAGFDS